MIFLEYGFSEHFLCTVSSYFTKYISNVKACFNKHMLSTLQKYEIEAIRPHLAFLMIFFV